MSKIYIILVLLAAAFITFSAFTGGTNSANSLSNDELIKFSHSFHSELAECLDCHSNVASSTSMSDRLLPNHDN